MPFSNGIFYVKSRTKILLCYYVKHIYFVYTVVLKWAGNTCVCQCEENEKVTFGTQFFYCQTSENK